MRRLLPRRRSDGRPIGVAGRVGRRASLPALAILIALAGCTPSGAPYECDCEFLTDFDDASRLGVRVCAANDREAPSVARGCAQLAAPAPVQSCTCRGGPPEPKPCREGCRD